MAREWPASDVLSARLAQLAETAPEAAPAAQPSMVKPPRPDILDIASPTDPYRVGSNVEVQWTEQSPADVSGRTAKIPKLSP